MYEQYQFFLISLINFFIPLQFDVITDWSRLFNVDIKSSRIYDAR